MLREQAIEPIYLLEWNELGGRDELIESFWNVIDALDAIATPIKEAFRAFFPKTTAEGLYSMTTALKAFTND